MSAALRAYSLSGKRRVLSPNSLAGNAASIARRTMEAESEAMTRKWKEGLISNSDLREFLTTYKDSPHLTPAEKVQVEQSLRTMDDLVQTEKLEADYKSAPDNSPQKVTAAQALSSYYSQKASSLISGTPGHSDATARAGQWLQTARAEQVKIESAQRAQSRAQKLYQVSLLPNGGVEELTAKQQAYTDLAAEARADGNETEALRYETLAQNVSDQIPALQQKLVSKEIKTYMEQLANDYHDGRIDETKYLAELNAIAPQIDESGDNSLIRAFDRTVDIVYKNQQAGGLRRGSTTDGLPVVLGKGAGSGAVTSWDKEDFDYSDNLRVAYELFKAGKVDGAKYSELLAKSVNERAGQLESRYNVLYEKARENPNDRVLYHGKKTRVADVLEDVIQEQDSLGVQVDSINRGTFAIVEVPPDQFNQSGKIKKSGKPVSTYQIIDTNNLPQDEYALDEKGIYHPISRQQQPLTPEQMANVVNGVYTDEKGNSQFVRFDAAGNPFIFSGKQTVDVYEPGTSNKQTLDYTAGMTVPAYKPPLAQGEQPQVAPEQPEIEAPPEPTLIEKAEQAIPQVPLRPKEQPQPQAQTPSIQSGQVNPRPTPMPSLAPSLPTNNQSLKLGSDFPKIPAVTPNISIEPPKQEGIKSLIDPNAGLLKQNNQPVKTDGLPTMTTGNPVGSFLKGVGSKVVDFAKKNIFNRPNWL